MCTTYEICLSSSKLTSDWIAFMRDKDSQPYLKKWYNEVYRNVA